MGLFDRFKKKEASRTNTTGRARRPSEYERTYVPPTPIYVDHEHDRERHEDFSDSAPVPSHDTGSGYEGQGDGGASSVPSYSGDSGGGGYSGGGDSGGGGGGGGGE